MVDIRRIKLTEEQLALVAPPNDEVPVRPQRDEVDAIINNVKIHTSLEQLGHVEDTKLRLMGIEASYALACTATSPPWYHTTVLSPCTLVTGAIP